MGSNRILPVVIDDLILQKKVKKLIPETKGPLSSGSFRMSGAALKEKGKPGRGDKGPERGALRTLFEENCTKQNYLKRLGDQDSITIINEVKKLHGTTQIRKAYL